MSRESLLLFFFERKEASGLAKSSASLGDVTRTIQVVTVPIHSHGCHEEKKVEFFFLDRFIQRLSCRHASVRNQALDCR